MTLSLSLSSSFKNNPGIFLLGGALFFSIILSLYTTYKSSVLLKELNKSAHEILDLEKKSSSNEILHVIKQEKEKEKEGEEKEKENVTLDLTEEDNFDNFDNQNDNDNDNEIQIIPSSKKTKKRKQ
jgi:exopolysaccharide biosynthesis protein